MVTGAGGFLGSHLVERLINLGAWVRSLVHYNSQNDWGQVKEHTVIHLCLKAFQIFPDLRIMLDLTLFLSSFPVNWEKLCQDTSLFQCQYPVY